MLYDMLVIINMTNTKQISINSEVVDILDKLITDVKEATGMKFSYTKAILLLAGRIKLNKDISLVPLTKE